MSAKGTTWKKEKAANPTPDYAIAIMSNLQKEVELLRNKVEQKDKEIIGLNALHELAAKEIERLKGLIEGLVYKLYDVLDDIPGTSANDVIKAKEAAWDQFRNDNNL